MVRVFRGLASVTLVGFGSACAPEPQPPADVADLCANVPEAEQIRPSFFAAGEIEVVRPAMGERRSIKEWVPEIRGAELVVRAEPGLTKEWVARLVRCHMAAQEPRLRAAESPLIVGAPSISFAEEETGFVIRIVGRNRQEGEDIFRRAQRFASNLPPPASSSRGDPPAGIK
jgi:hypothetical protein